jgi:hypothetical protein
MTIGVSAVPEIPFAGCVVTTRRVAAACLAVAVKTTGDPASVPEVAETLCAPTVGPSVHIV